MIIFIIASILMVAFFSYLSYSEKEGIGSYILSLVAGILVGGIIWFAFCVVANTFAQRTWQHQYDYDIYAMQDNITNTRYYAGTGRNGSTLGYYHLAREGDGYKVYSLPQDETAVIETDSQPKVSCYKLDFTNNFLKENCAVFSFGRYQDYKLYIPKGSIKFDFSVDLKN